MTIPAAQAIESLIPHRAPMLFVKSLDACTDLTATATARFTADHFVVSNGEVSEAALVECAAQTIAAAMGHRARSKGVTGAPPNGMLIAVNHFKIQSAPPLDQNLSIDIREIKRLGLMLMISAIISCEGREIASGELTLYA